MRTLAHLSLICLATLPATAGDLESYLTGEMSRLEVLESPVSLARHQITFPDGEERALEEKQGKVLLVNLWARGCVPCKDEMKDFAALQRELGDERFEVVALPMEKRSTKAIRKILTSWEAGNLEPYGNDPRALARVLHDEGFFTESQISFVYPTTYVVNKKGEILALHEGFLHWDNAEARALITALKDDEVPVP